MAEQLSIRQLEKELLGLALKYGKFKYSERYLTQTLGFSPAVIDLDEIRRLEVCLLEMAQKYEQAVQPVSDQENPPSQAEQGRIRHLEQKLQEMTLKYEQSRQAMVHVTQALSNPSAIDNAKNADSKLDQLIAVMQSKSTDRKLDQLIEIMQSNQAGNSSNTDSKLDQLIVAVNGLTEAVHNGVLEQKKTNELLANRPEEQRNSPLDLLFKYGLTEILTDSLCFVKSRLTVVEDDLFLDGKIIDDIVQFKRVVQIKPWVYFPAEYVVNCLHCNSHIVMENCTEDLNSIVCYQENCEKITPFYRLPVGYFWTKCTHCAAVMENKIPTFQFVPVHEEKCSSCNRSFEIKDFTDAHLIRTPRRIFSSNE